MGVIAHFGEMLRQETMKAAVVNFSGDVGKPNYVGHGIGGIRS